MNLATRATHWIITFAIVGFGVGCASTYLPHTEIEDTPDTRAIYDVVVAYQNAMEQRNVDALMGLVSHRYYENSGSTERDDDDYGYEQLRDKVAPLLKENIKAVRYRVILRNIEIDDGRAWADFEYFFNFKYVEGGDEGWAQKNDFNRLEFGQERGRWKIIGGL